MKKFLKKFIPATIGISLLIIGFIYDLTFAGIPYQDPNPAIQSQWEFHRHIANIIYIVGICTFIIGILAIPFIFKNQKTQ